MHEAVSFWRGIILLPQNIYHQLFSDGYEWISAGWLDLKPLELMKN